jgi:hypothetical protein
VKIDGFVLVVKEKSIQHKGLSFQVRLAPGLGKTLRR